MRRLDGFSLVVAAALTVGCGKHYLSHYQFADRSLAVVFLQPPSPELLHGWYDLGPMNGGSPVQTAVQTAVHVGAGVVKEVEARKASTRLDSAVTLVDIEARLAQRTLERASRYLGTRPVVTPDAADYILEVDLRRFGIDARSSHATYLYTRAEAVLIDRKTGREIWREKVRGRDRLTPWIIGAPSVPSAIFTAATLHNVSIEDFQQALEQLVTYTSELITNDLRDKLRDVRDR